MSFSHQLIPLCDVNNQRQNEQPGYFREAEIANTILSCDQSDHRQRRSCRWIAPESAPLPVPAISGGPPRGDLRDDLRDDLEAGINGFIGALFHIGELE